MLTKHLLSSLGLIALAAIAPLASAAPTASGTVYFDLAGLTSQLQTNTLGFSGWQYTSVTSANAGNASDGHTQAVANVQSSVGSAKASTQAGQLSVETGVNGASQSYQQMTTTFQLAGGQHLIYSVAYTMVMHKELLPERVDLGAGFIIDTEESGYTVDKLISTLDWKVPLGTSSESNLLEIDMYNPYTTPFSFTLTGWLGAGSSSPGASVVPEPDTYAMLLLGLGLLGYAARRRS